MKKLMVLLLPLIGTITVTVSAVYFENKPIENDSIPPVSMYNNYH